MDCFVLGSGGMATVYKAYQPGLDRYIAVKILPPGQAQQPGFRERFQREAKATFIIYHNAAILGDVVLCVIEGVGHQ